MAPRGLAMVPDTVGAKPRWHYYFLQDPQGWTEACPIGALYIV